MSNDSGYSSEDGLRRTALLAATTWWAAPAKLAIALSGHGCRVEAICPPDHPFRFMQSVGKTYRYRCQDTLASLHEAIVLSQAAVIVPCDDGAVWQLSELYRTRPELRPLIERSLGEVKGYDLAPSRASFMGAAERLNIRTPATRPIATTAQLEEWFRQPDTSGVLKLDRSYGGSGVFVVHSLAEAERAYATLRRPVSFLAAYMRWLAIRDVVVFWNREQHKERVVSVQQFISGRPANTMLVCHQGRILAMLTVEVFSTDGKDSGPALVSRLIENSEIRSAAEKIVSEFGLSGFHGLDFMLEEETGKAYLIEWNPRCTQLGHLNIAGKGDLAGVFCEQFMGIPNQPRGEGTSEKMIAFFPQALLSHTEFFRMGAMFVDIPWEEPRLRHELIRRDWRERRLVGRLLLKLRSRKRAPVRASIAASGSSSEASKSSSKSTVAPL